MANTKLGVFPASGGLGNSIIKHLLPQVPASDLVLVARQPQKLTAVKAAGAEVRKANFEDAASFSNAFEGIDCLFLISYASLTDEYRAKVRCHSVIPVRDIANGWKSLIEHTGPNKCHRCCS
jgi:uncharacterized protein YbjT (DUF2867 family)